MKNTLPHRSQKTVPSYGTGLATSLSVTHSQGDGGIQRQSAAKLVSAASPKKTAATEQARGGGFALVQAGHDHSTGAIDISAAPADFARVTAELTTRRGGR